jgi:hypothetical protein
VACGLKQIDWCTALSRKESETAGVRKKRLGEHLYSRKAALLNACFSNPRTKLWDRVHRRACRVNVHTQNAMKRRSSVVE